MRQDGFYWIRFDESTEVGFWNGDAWEVIGSEALFEDKFVGVVSERLEVPKDDS